MPKGKPHDSSFAFATSWAHVPPAGDVHSLSCVLRGLLPSCAGRAVFAMGGSGWGVAAQVWRMLSRCEQGSCSDVLVGGPQATPWCAGGVAQAKRVGRL